MQCLVLLVFFMYYEAYEDVYDGKNLTISIETSSLSDLVTRESTIAIGDQKPSMSSISTSSFCNSVQSPGVEDGQYSTASPFPASSPGEQLEHDRHPPINKRKRSSIQNNLLNGRFLDAESLCELLQNGSVANLSIPKGIKEDVYFLIENNNNIKKRLCGEKSNFEDDCGANGILKHRLPKKLFFTMSLASLR